MRSWRKRVRNARARRRSARDRARSQPHDDRPRALAKTIRSRRPRALRQPRFVTSMALWAIVSRGYGRFDAARFDREFREAGIEPIACHPTLAGLGLFGVGRRLRDDV